MHALVTIAELFICALLAQSFQEMYQRKKEPVVKVFCFFFKSFVVVVAHNEVKGMIIVNSVM